VAIDGAGNLFIADTGNGRIRRVDATTHIITTVAGNGTSGFSGDGGPATAAELGGPYGVAIDRAGDLFIADYSNQRIRRVDATTHIITTVAGNGTYGSTGDGGLATAAGLVGPVAVAIDGAGDFFIGDGYGNRVRRVDATTGIITTVAGNGTPGFSGDGGPATAAELNYPADVAIDGAGALFITDTGNERIRRVDATTGTITTVAGNGTFGFSGDCGPATAAQLDLPQGLALDAAGDLFIADWGNNRVRDVGGGTLPRNCSCTGSTSDGWSYTAEVTSGEGLVVKDVRYGPRLLARRISVPYVVVTRTNGGPEYGRLTPTPGAAGDLESNLTSNLSCQSLPLTCTTASPANAGRPCTTDTDCGAPNSCVSDSLATATYQLTTDEGYNILVEQSYRFAPLDPNDKHCESSKTLPCARFWPTVTWALDPNSPPPPTFKGFESVQRFEFDPDAVGHSVGELVADTVSATFSPPFHIHVGAGELGRRGYLTKEDSRSVILNGQRYKWDNWHQSSRSSVALPGDDPFDKTPGCSDCVHAHWGWGLDANCGCNGAPPGCRDVHCWTDGQPEILTGSQQCVEAAWVKYAPAEVDPWPVIKGCQPRTPMGASESQHPCQAYSPPYLWQCLMDWRMGNGKGSKINNTTDRVVVYWDAFTSAENVVPVNLPAAPDYLGDSYWPRLIDLPDGSGPVDGHDATEGKIDRSHGNGGEMFFMAARPLSPLAATSPPEQWTIAPQWDQVVYQPVALDPRLPAGYVLPVVVGYAPTTPLPFPFFERGPFYLRVNGNCISTALLNADPLYAENATGPPWVALHAGDAYSSQSQTFVGGDLLTQLSIGEPVTSYLVFPVFPDPGDATENLTFEVVSAPNGPDGYVPSSDVDLGSLSCPCAFGYFCF
jgi:sugar lactone lactonase YvrE